MTEATVEALRELIDEFRDSGQSEYRTVGDFLDDLVNDPENDLQLIASSMGEMAEAVRRVQKEVRMLRQAEGRKGQKKPKTRRYDNGTA